MAAGREGRFEEKIKYENDEIHEKPNSFTGFGSKPIIWAANHRYYNEIWNPNNDVCKFEYHRGKQ
jgi:hypothetical protein